MSDGLRDAERPFGAQKGAGDVVAAALHALLTALRAAVTTDETGAAFDRVLGDCADQLYAAGARPAPRPLSFAQLRAANVQRCETAFHKLDAWSPAEWANAMAGEVGEACNVAKKILRGDFKTEGELRFAYGALAKEIADVVIYADLLAARCGIDLGEAVCQKFNEVSARRGSAITL